MRRRHASQQGTHSIPMGFFSFFFSKKNERMRFESVEEKYVQLEIHTFLFCSFSFHVSAELANKQTVLVARQFIYHYLASIVVVGLWPPFSFLSFLFFCSLSLSLIYFWSVCNFSNYIRSVKPHTRIPQNRKICQFVMGHDGPMQQQQWPQAKSLTAQQNGRLLSAHRFRILLLWRFVYCILSFCCCVAPQTIFVTMLPLAIGGICRVGRKAFRLLTDLWLNSSRLQIRIHTHINWRCDCDKENTARPYIEHYNQREIVPLLCV